MFFHSAHIVSYSIYPLFLRIGALGLTTSILVFFKTGWLVNIFFFFLYFFIIIILWMKDVRWEGASGYHNFKVNYGFKLGFVLFVFTEILFFFRIFWVFYDKIFIHLNSWWPVINLFIDFKRLPLVGTFILLFSRVTATWAHYNLINNKTLKWTLLLTVGLGVLFLCIQIFEYLILLMDLGDGFYGSLFFFGTGFHGFHVLLGVIILGICLSRRLRNQFNKGNHLIFESGVIYWHFVDVVWLLLYLSLYTVF